jgi:hypothetical protein
MEDLNPFRYSSNSEDNLLTQLSDELYGIISKYITDFTTGPKTVFCTRLAEKTYELHFYPTETFSHFLKDYFSLFQEKLDECSDIEQIGRLLFDAADHNNVDFYYGLSLKNRLSIKKDQIAKEYLSEFIQYSKDNISSIISEFEWNKKALCESAAFFSNESFKQRLLEQTEDLSIAKKRSYLLEIVKHLKGNKLDKPYDWRDDYGISSYKWDGDQNFSNQEYFNFDHAFGKMQVIQRQKKLIEFVNDLVPSETTRTIFFEDKEQIRILKSNLKTLPTFNKRKFDWLIANRTIVKPNPTKSYKTDVGKNLTPKAKAADTIRFISNALKKFSPKNKKVDIQLWIFSLFEGEENFSISNIRESPKRKKMEI